MVVMKLLQRRTENGMFGHPAGSAFAQVSSRCRFLNDKTSKHNGVHLAQLQKKSKELERCTRYKMED